MTAPRLSQARRQPRPATAIAKAREALEVAMREVEDADTRRGRWESKLIDQAIVAFANYGRPFSANDLRELLPEVNTALIGNRFSHAYKQWQLIRPVGLVTSTKKNTHTKRICTWIRADQEAAAS